MKIALIARLYDQVTHTGLSDWFIAAARSATDRGGFAAACGLLTSTYAIHGTDENIVRLEQFT